MKRIFALFLFLSSAAWAQSPAPSQPPAAQDVSSKFASDCPYPEAARKAGVQGLTGVTYTVTDDWVIKDVTVVVSSGNSDLDSATISCVGHWRISPELKYLKPSKAWRTVISWTIPATGEAVGRFAGWPHTCSSYYPAAEFQAGIGGITKVSFRVKTDGYVSDIKVAQSSGNVHLDNAAMACTRFWHYIPAHSNGEPIEVPWQVNIVWKAPNPPPDSPPPK